MSDKATPSTAAEKAMLEVDPREAADHLFASSTLVDLLVLLCSDPGRRYYVNELIRQTGRFPRSIQLALAKMETAGVVRSEREANVRYYQVASDHPFFPELSSMCVKLADVTFVLRRAVGGLEGVRAAFIRPDEPDSTDLDLVVVGEERARLALDLALSTVSTRVGRKVHGEFIATEEWIRQARRERSFVRWLLEEPKRYVVGGDSDLPDR